MELSAGYDHLLTECFGLSRGPWFASAVGMTGGKWGEGAERGHGRKDEVSTQNDGKQRQTGSKTKGQKGWGSTQKNGEQGAKRGAEREGGTQWQEDAKWGKREGRERERKPRGVRSPTQKERKAGT